MVRSSPPLQRRSLIDLLTARLRDDILDGRYREGATLPAERELAGKLGVNRTSLKHALLRLEQLGLIAIRHGIGSVVLDPYQSAGAELIAHLVFRSTGVDEEMLEDLVEARGLLGAFLAHLAARRRSDADVHRLRDCIRRLDPGDAPDAPEAVQAVELDFFRALVRATDNRVFIFLANSLFAVYQARSRTFVNAFDDAAFVPAALTGIADAVDEGDADAAERRALDYLRENGDRLMEAIRAHDERAS